MTIRTSKCNTIMRSRPQLFFFGFMIQELVCLLPGWYGANWVCWDHSGTIAKALSLRVCAGGIWQSLHIDPRLF
jgi:hypothetical protein